MKEAVFITGTDTGIGKTLTSTLLVSALAQTGKRPGYFKPTQTGSELDIDAIKSWTQHLDVSVASSVYTFPEPIAPSRAARLNGEIVDLGTIAKAWDLLDARPWVIEGAGGVLVPLNEKETICDLIIRLDVPVLLVASTRLGTINHTLMSLKVLEQAGALVRGIVLNGDEDPGLIETLHDFASAHVIASIPRLPTIEPSSIARASRATFNEEVLRSIFKGGGIHEC